MKEVETCLGNVIADSLTAGHTTLEVVCADRAGLLADMASALTAIGCNVIAAEVWTHNNRAAFVVHVTGADGVMIIRDEAMLEHMRAQVGALMADEAGTKDRVQGLGIANAQCHT